jgi:putative ABC transport system permease protein
MGRSKRILDDLAYDIQDHIDRETQDNIERGMSPEEARYAAMRKFGNVTRVMEDTREVWIARWLEELLQDARFAFRMLRKNPGFTAVAMLTLALGIGANTAIFSVVYSVLLKPLPYAKSEQLVNVFQELSQQQNSRTGMSYLNFADLREHNSVFSEIAATQAHQLTLTGRGEPVLVDTSVVTPELFSLFGQQPLAGRTFLPEDGKAGALPVVVLSEGLWRGTFASDPKVIGSSIDLDKRSFTVVGIVPASFRFPRVTQPNQLWVPMAQDPLFGGWMARREGHWLGVTARLKPGVTMTQAQAEMDAISAQLAQQFPEENTGWVIQMTPLQQTLVGNVRPALLVLLGAVGLVLLIACANIANLLLSRATSRAREIAVRSALGAGRARILRQLVSETAVLGLLGGVAGILLAYVGVRALISLLPSNFPLVNAIHLDYVVLGFALLLSAVASFVFGLAPAFLVANSSLLSSLREGGARSGESGRGHRVRSVLAAAEIALAMVVLVAAGLLLRSFSKLTAVDPGFDVQHIWRAEIDLPRFQYSTPQQWVSFSDELLGSIQSEPGLKDSALAVPTPIGDGFVNLGFDIVGTPPASASTSRTADYVSVSPNYFSVMGIPLMSGRFFSSHDVLSSPRVTAISKSMARVYFPNEDPLGKRLVFGFPPDPGVEREIVGVVGDVRDVSLGQDPKPMMYVPFAQAPFPGAVVVVKSTLNSSTVAGAIRLEVAKIDKDLPVTNAATMTEILNSSVEQPRFRTLLLTLFAGMALVLAATGIFGVISYSVSRRTQEIGIRMALGASTSAILRMITRETMRLIVVGLAVGTLGALAASRLLSRLLFGVSPSDPVTLALVASTLVTVAAIAFYVPMRRAMSVDPVIALRHE